jgi:phosphoesterase RecJ-like protein
MLAPRLVDEARLRIQQAHKVMVISHIRPDGDAVGSLLGLGLALEQAGKQVQMVLADGLPENFRFLTHSEKITHQGQGPVDLTIVVDCSDIDRIGPVINGQKTPDINIDHHKTNRNFAQINLVDDEAAATAEILAAYLPALGLELSHVVVIPLLTGILTDTIGFRTNNVRPLTLRMAADLMEAGANLPELYNITLSQHSLTAMRYWGAGLTNIQLDGRIAWASLSLDDRKRVGYPGRDDADLINILSTLKEADVVIVFVEQSGESVKISWRAQNGFDVSHVAMQFGGGGHAAASGAEIKAPLSQVQDLVLDATKSLIQSKITK